MAIRKLMLFSGITGFLLGVMMAPLFAFSQSKMAEADRLCNTRHHPGNLEKSIAILKVLCEEEPAEKPFVTDLSRFEYRSCRMCCLFEY